MTAVRYDDNESQKVKETFKAEAAGSGNDRYVSLDAGGGGAFELGQYDINQADVNVKASYAYNGKARRPVTLTFDGKKLKKDTDYAIIYRNNRNVGTASAMIVGIGDFIGTHKITFRITPAKNSIKVKPLSKKIRYRALKKKAATFRLKATVKGKAKTTFKLTSVPKKAKKFIKVTSKGKVTIKKKLPKGTYRLKVKVTAKKTKNYKKTAVTKKLKIVVR